MKRLIAFSLAVLMVLGLCACTEQEPTETTRPWPSGPLYEIESYTASDEDILAALDTVIGYVGDRELTLRLLCIAYWTEYTSYMQSYGSYVYTLGLDPYAPLDSQTIPGIGGTWQQFFLKSALDTLHEFAAITQEGLSKGEQLPEDMQQQLDQMIADLQPAAEEMGYATAEEMLRAQYGPGCTVDDMYQYLYLSAYSYFYYTSCLEKLVIPDEQVQNYFNDNELDLSYSGIVKDGRLTYVCRNIFVAVEEEDWDKCETEAQAILALWRSGEMTEEAFSALALEHSQDGETAPLGGLRDGMTELSNMGEDVVAWYMDPARQIGDYQLFKCEDGYDLLYFCGTEEYWHYMCRLAVQNLTSEAVRQEMLDLHPLQVDYTKILLSDIELDSDTEE